MEDNGDGSANNSRSTTREYTYKFRNGYYNYWDSPGWESDNSLIDTVVQGVIMIEW